MVLILRVRLLKGNYVSYAALAGADTLLRIEIKSFVRTHSYRRGQYHAGRQVLSACNA